MYPFTLHSFRKKKYKHISVEKLDEIKTDFKNEYGLYIPSNPTITILNRLRRKKLIRKEHGHFIPVLENLKKINISSESSRIERQYEYVVTKLIEFVKNEHDEVINREEIDKTLIDYLRKHDLDLLFAAERNSVLPKIKSSKKLHYFINEFFGEAFKSEPELFKFIVDLSVGHAISSTILFNDFNQYAGKFRGLSIFLDTPFVLNLLGINGIHKKSLAEELITILNEEGVNLYVLEITQGEITSNLHEALNLMEKGKLDPNKGPLTYRSCMEYGISENDLEQLILKLDDIYENKCISKERIPNYDDFRDFQIDEEKLYDKIVEVYDSSKVGSKKEEKKDEKKDEKINNTIYRDVKVLSGVYRFRLGNHPKTLKDCKYLFVTTSSTLAFASRCFETSENGNKYSLPTCLTDVFIGTLLWLHSPNQIEIINEKKIIADCYAALKPDDNLISKYLDDVEKLRKGGIINDDEYILLRTHRVAINMLENKTFGDVDEFTSETTKEILEDLIQRIKNSEIDKLNLEKAEHEKTKEQLDDAKNQIKNTESLLNRERQLDIQRILKRNTNIKRKSSRKAKAILIALQVLFIFLVFIPIFILGMDKFSNKTIIPEIINISWLAFTVFGVLNIISGFNINGIRKKFHYRLSNRIEKKKRKEIERFEK